jgi:hypothetical protein
MVLTLPMMLLGLLALPALAAIYWLRSRSQRAVVSSLMLWSDIRRPKQGGRIVQRLQTPLTFLLELLAITLLVFAASGPAFSKKDVVRPLIVVLDDSYSMLARDVSMTHAATPEQDSPRIRAENAMVAELAGDNYVVRFVVAGAEPRLWDEPVQDAAEAGKLLTQWKCQSETADLAKALALAAEVGGPDSRLLVLTDHAPAMALDGGQTEWWAFGRKLPNMAMTAATRTRGDETERVLLEVANLSDSPGQTTLTLEGGNLASPRKTPLQLPANGVKQLFLTLPVGSPPLRAVLDDDALATDNQVALLAESAKPARVLVDLADENLRRMAVRALEASGRAVIVTDLPECVISDKSGPLAGDAWRMEILGGKDPVAYAGPFVIDRSHVLTQGLSLENAVWSRASGTQLGGAPVVTAGDVPMLTDLADSDGRHRVQMAFIEKTSNLQDSPDWPILFANWVQWRQAGYPGVRGPNVRLGQSVAVALASDASVEVVAPSGATHTVRSRSRRVDVPARQIGLYTIKASSAQYQFSCNATAREESDLQGCQTGRWGDWNNTPTYQDRRIGLAWVFALLAMATMAGHLAMIARNASEHAA